MASSLFTRLYCATNNTRTLYHRAVVLFRVESKPNQCSDKVSFEMAGELLNPSFGYAP